jgi:tetratricopeptide (TPR) repeat protein
MEKDNFSSESEGLISPVRIMDISEETKEPEIRCSMQESETRQLAEEIFFKCTIPGARALIGAVYKKFSASQMGINQPSDLLAAIEKISKALKPWMKESSPYREPAVILQIGLLLSTSTLLIASGQDADIKVATSFFEQEQEYYSEIFEKNPALVDALLLCSMDEKYKIVHTSLPTWLDIYWEEYCNGVSDNESGQNASPSRSKKEENIFPSYFNREDVIKALKYYKVILNHYLKGAAQAYENLSRLYRVLNDHKNSTKHLRKANNIYEQILQAEDVDRNNESMQGISPSRSMQEKDNFHSYTKERATKLLEYYQEILNYYMKNAAPTYEKISRLYQALEDNENAVKHLRKAGDIYARLNQKEDIDRVVKKIQKLQVSRAEFDVAPSFFSSRQSRPSPVNQASAINKKKCCCLIL